MTIRIIVNGAYGKMGQATVQTLTQAVAFTVVAQAGRNDDLAALIQQQQADVVVDFTTATAAFANAQTIIAAGARPVIGTSGLLPAQIEQLQQRCAEKKLGGIIAPNFSIGAVLMMRYARDCSRYFPDVEIIELHHSQKKDAPSATAMRTAQLIAANRTHRPVPVSDEVATISGTRGAKHEDVPIHSIRLPGFIAHQEVIFASSLERISIRHDALSRDVFMPGVSLACQKVMTLDHLVYGLEEIV